MTTALLVSTAALWAVVLALVGVVVALTRQIGVLYERVAPAGALTMAAGPAVGAAAPVVAVESLDGAAHAVGEARADGRSTLVLFVSPTCPVCKELLPAVRGVRRAERRTLDVILASDGPRAEHEAFVRRERLDDVPYVLSPSLGVTYRVGKLPWAVLIDAEGIVRAKGLVNTREHLESLLEAQALGVASIQDHLRQQEEPVGGTAA